MAHNRHKETDRIADLARELRKFGGRVEEHADGLTIWPASFESAGAIIETYNDHRMAMSLLTSRTENAGCYYPQPSMHSQDLSELLARSGTS